MVRKPATFAEIGEVFIDATTRLVGGISPANKMAVLKDLATVQNSLDTLMHRNPADFQGVAGIHAQNIIDQLNLEKAAVMAVGSDPFAAKYINDVHCDLIDIVQGDEALAALATAGGHNGFAAAADLLVGPAQFRGNAEQTDFMRGFVATAQDFADRANVLAGQDPANAAKACRAACGSASAWHAPCSDGRRWSCSTSRAPISTGTGRRPTPLATGGSRATLPRTVGRGHRRFAAGSARRALAGERRPDHAGPPADRPDRGADARPCGADHCAC